MRRNEIAELGAGEVAAQLRNELLDVNEEWRRGVELRAAELLEEGSRALEAERRRLRAAERDLADANVCEYCVHQSEWTAEMMCPRLKAQMVGGKGFRQCLGFEWRGLCEENDEWDAE